MIHVLNIKLITMYRPIEFCVIYLTIKSKVILEEISCTTCVPELPVRISMMASICFVLLKSVQSLNFHPRVFCWVSFSILVIKLYLVPYQS